MASLRDNYQVVADEDVTYALGNLTLGHDPRPDLSRLASFPRTELPTFLFRTYSDQSMGVNTPEAFRCQYYKRYPEKIFSLVEQDPTVIKRYLQNHVDNDKTG